jgi:predicted ATPase/class 3 adenylate cyclase
VRGLPSGTVTFLFTDVEGSTALLNELGAEEYAHELAGHRQVLRTAFKRHGGVEVDTQGDAFFVAFATAPGALAAAAQAQAELVQGPIHVRMGVHTGSPLLTSEGYVGADVHRAARIAAVAHGGQVLVSAATAALVDRNRLRDLGEHRLKDLSAPERLYQYGAGAFPAPKSLYRTNLPVPATSFLGRRAELAEIVGLLEREDVRVLTLTGAGGIGKTRLALRAAAEVAERYADGVFWVNLAALRDPQLVLQAVATELEAKDDLIARIRDDCILLLLDNFEQVIEAASEVGALVAACPRLDLLVTSRESLRVAGEWVVAVPPLNEGDAESFFFERALAACPDFTGDGEVGAICQRLDNLPLAIELAAARAAVLSAGELLDHLDRCLPTLTSGRRDAPERQRTLRGAIAWSYELLTPEERRLFGRLSIFAGGCTLEAAESVCHADLETLASLVDKSLIRHRERRYWMLETIREFSSEELIRAGEYAATAAAHAEFFAAWTELAESHFGTSVEPTWMRLLACEHDNIRAALAYSAGSPRQLRLASALWLFWDKQGHYTEGRRWLRAALARREGAPPWHVAGALLGAGVLARFQGDFDEAERLMNESIAIAQRAGLESLEARAVGSLGTVALVRGDLQHGAELLAKSEGLFRQLGDEKRLALTASNRAHIALEMGDFEGAFALAQEARSFFWKLDAREDVVVADMNLALAARSIGREDVASGALTEGLELARDAGHPAPLVEALIVAAALIAPRDPTAAAALVAVVERARRDLMLELDPLLRKLRGEVQNHLRSMRGIETWGEESTSDLPAVLDTAAARALASLAKLMDATERDAGEPP